MTIGFHMLGDQGLHTSHAVDVAKQTKAKYHVVLNNPDQARQVQAAGATVIYRRWKNDPGVGNKNGDDSAHLYYDPRHFVRLIHAEAPPGCLLYLGNEPDTHDLPRLNQWTMDALDECEKLGRKGVIFNFATGNPEREAWQVLRGAVEKAAAGEHILGLHQYFDNSVMKDYPHHVGRHEVLYELFSRVPQIVITEIAHVERFDPYIGWRKVGMTLEKYAGELRQALQIYQRRGIHACLFALVPEDTQKWGSFAPTKPLLDEIAKLNALPAPPVEEKPPVSAIERVPKPASAGEPVSGIVQTTSNIRIRIAPDPNAPIAGRANQGNVALHYPATEREAGGYKWRYVEVKASDTVEITGWMALVWPAWSDQFRSAEPDPTAPPLMLGNPLSVRWRILSPFNAPRNFSQWPDKKQLHEGLDFVPLAGEPEPYEVLAMQSGVIESIGNQDNGYGRYVRIRTDWHGQTYRFWYAHMQAITAGLKVGQQVGIGETLGIMGNTGFSSEPHLHVTIAHEGRGLKGYVVDDVIDFTHLLPSQEAPQEPPAEEEPPVEEPKPVDELQQRVWAALDAWIDAENQAREANQRASELGFTFRSLYAEYLSLRQETIEEAQRKAA